ncbi:isoaspartyl peptidase/L-asparaginase [Ichthyenterobacterium sp. W332]|uniref:Isoaspartyl peptidase/L-asparaginase n=1 Tax=Microcosmobacter mediterraneus TaxID=3075607 RepID=A0ABU2YKK0_9FLAO|nr:isoaspartyl peptidase/L-asparaginase [Ichthyenterobacterium sp. W332]MDT0557755.1 isoaspartyl peptidase/L-asparaginase [Ichthyenterobacterium sp. W332]
MQTFSIAIHGGAGTLVKGMMTPELEARYKQDLKIALNAGYAILKAGESAVDAVEVAVKHLEDSPLFNAGKGSVFTATGSHEMDASIMDGNTLNAGGVSLISGIKNPVSLARDVMEKSEHVFLAGEGAMKFATELNYTLEEDTYFYDKFRHQQWLEIKDTDNFQLDHSKSTNENEDSVAEHSRSQKDSKFGTVGAVACDQDGNIAAATSTGGMTNKKWGRVGDSPMIGAGNYANNKTCAVSCTGSGEFFIRGVVAYDVSCLMEHKGLTLQQASEEVINKRILEINGDGGLIAVDTQGNIAMPFNTEGMYRAFKTSEGKEEISIYK